MKINHKKKDSYLEGFVYGAVDGTVTTFAIVAGVAGASLSAAIVLILGFANLFADGFSMSVSNYLSTRARQQYLESLRKKEKKEIKTYPEQEKMQLKRLFAKKGFKGDILDKIVSVISTNKKVWVNTIVSDDYGLEFETKNPKISAILTMISFVLIGLIPLIPYILGTWIASIETIAFKLSILFTSIAFLIIGAIKAKVVKKPVVSSSLETFLLGGGAAAIAYIVGYLLRGLV